LPCYAVVIVEAVSLLPGVALYWTLHTIADFLSVKSASSE
jgi:hypothetical protein